MKRTIDVLLATGALVSGIASAQISPFQHTQPSVTIEGYQTPRVRAIQTPDGKIILRSESNPRTYEDSNTSQPPSLTEILTRRSNQLFSPAPRQSFPYMPQPSESPVLPQPYQEDTASPPHHHSSQEDLQAEKERAAAIKSQEEAQTKARLESEQRARAQQAKEARMRSEQLLIDQAGEKAAREQAETTRIEQQRAAIERQTREKEIVENREKAEIALKQRIEESKPAILPLNVVEKLRTGDIIYTIKPAGEAPDTVGLRYNHVTGVFQSITDSRTLKEGTVFSKEYLQEKAREGAVYLANPKHHSKSGMLITSPESRVNDISFIIQSLEQREAERIRNQTENRLAQASVTAQESFMTPPPLKNPIHIEASSTEVEVRAITPLQKVEVKPLEPQKYEANRGMGVLSNRPEQNLSSSQKKEYSQPSPEPQHQTSVNEINFSLVLTLQYTAGKTEVIGTKSGPFKVPYSSLSDMLSTTQINQLELLMTSSSNANSNSESPILSNPWQAIRVLRHLNYLIPWEGGIKNGKPYLSHSVLQWFDGKIENNNPEAIKFYLVPSLPIGIK